MVQRFGSARFRRSCPARGSAAAAGAGSRFGRRSTRSGFVLEDFCDVPGITSRSLVPGHEA